MKKYWVLISGIIFLAIILGIIRVETIGNYYKYTPEEVHERSLNTEIFIDSAGIASTKESVLIIHLSDDSVEDLKIPEGILAVNINPENLLDRESKKLYKNHSGVIVLSSHRATIAANSWVLLNRMGYRNIKILGISEAETFKYSFQPDSIAGLK